MASSSFYCPFCFDRIQASEIRNYCRNKCDGDYGYPNKYVKCYRCNTMVVPGCPTCKAYLPLEIEKLSDLFISVIGAKGSGKSHYIATLIYRIKQIHNEFGWTLHELDDQTITRYTDNFYKPLFEGRRALQATQRARSQSDVNHPLLYSLCFSKGWRKRQVMLAFFDTAGEDLDANVYEMTTVNKYIINSSGIICLLDPLQFSRVRASVETYMGKQALPSQGTDTAAIINRIARLIRQGHRIQGKSAAEIKIPLAVAFSKIDAIGMPDEKCDKTLLPKSCSIFNETRHKGMLHRAESKTIHQLMEGWLAEVDPTQDIFNQLKAFKYISYFGLSALGCNPLLTGDKLEHDPRPMRVEDPFLWILHQNGLIKMKG